MNRWTLISVESKRNVKGLEKKKNVLNFEMCLCFTKATYRIINEINEKRITNSFELN